MRYTKEVRFRFEGDESAARRLVPVARTFLGQTWNAAELGGLQQYTQRKTLPTGEQFELVVTPWGPEVTIYVPPTGAPEEEEEEVLVYAYVRTETGYQEGIVELVALSENMKRVEKRLVFPAENAYQIAYSSGIPYTDFAVAGDTDAPVYAVSNVDSVVFSNGPSLSAPTGQEYWGVATDGNEFVTLRYVADADPPYRHDFYDFDGVFLRTCIPQPPVVPASASANGESYETDIQLTYLRASPGRLFTTWTSIDGQNLITPWEFSSSTCDPIKSAFLGRESYADYDATETRRAVISADSSTVYLDTFLRDMQHYNSFVVAGASPQGSLPLTNTPVIAENYVAVFVATLDPAFPTWQNVAQRSEIVVYSAGGDHKLDLVEKERIDFTERTGYTRPVVTTINKTQMLKLGGL